MGDDTTYGNEVLKRATGCFEIPVPAQPGATFPQLTFQDIARPGTAEKIGHIRDHVLFCNPFHPEKEHIDISLMIKAPGTPIIVPNVLEQYSGAIQNIVDYHAKQNYAFGDYIYLSLRQGNEGRTIGEDGGFTDPHLDVLTDAYAEEGSCNGHVYSVSDMLMTPFFRIDELDVSQEIINGDSSYDMKMHIDNAVSRAAEQENKYHFDPFDIAHFRFNTPHGIATMKEKHHRSLLLMGFMSPTKSQIEGEGFDNLNNPWLEEKFKALEQTGAAPLPPGRT
jgi:hypothetical protein